MSARHQCNVRIALSPALFRILPVTTTERLRYACSSSACQKQAVWVLSVSHVGSGLAEFNLREEILQTRDETVKKRVGWMRRAKRAAREEEEEMDLHLQLRAFAAGLAEECPKCGIDFCELMLEGLTVTAEIHLMN
jgi:hypothetical protein